MRERKALGIILLCILGLSGCGSTKESVSKSSSEVEIITQTNFEITEENASVSEESGTDTEESRITTETQKKGILIAIDPGHQGPNVDMSAQEPNAPGSSVMKTKATGGTSGRYSGVPEYQLNLDISLQLREALMEEGYDVILTRTDNDTAISNAERATLANDAGADAAIRIHANGSEDSGVNGALVLIGSEDNSYVGHLYPDSYALGESVLTAYCNETGMKNLGIQTNDTMTGINWSQIPVIILEMGFMSNQQDDLNMEDPDYQGRMVQGIVNGVNDYFGYEERTAGEDSAAEVTELKEKIERIIQSDQPDGAVVSVYVESLTDGSYVNLSKGKMKAASLIKLYVAGCVYEERERLQQQTGSDEMERLVHQMLSASDNDATNQLIRYLGNGSARTGMELVNTYCSEHGFADTSMGRLMLDFSSDSENYTSVSDCTGFMKKIYGDELEGSDRILQALKQQERTAKIPAGIPDGVFTANKTGELEDVENDIAIVFLDGHEYILSVMTEELTDTAAARNLITELSELVYGYEAE